MAEVVELVSDDEAGEDNPGPTRAELRPTACANEAAWFNQTFPVPDSQVINSTIPNDSILAFQDLIWNKPHDRMVPGYGLTPKELASVSMEGRQGWLVTSHFYWMSRCINSQQDHTRFFVLDPAIRKASIERLLVNKTSSQIQQLVFVLSVGRQDDGKVFLGTDKEPGDHWSMAVVDIQKGILTYCDTLGWPQPTNLVQAVLRFTNCITKIAQMKVRLAHEPSVAEQHTCTKVCTNYPLQTCSDVCGIITMVCIAVATLDKPLFELILCPGLLNLYLTDPTQYSTYLRHVVLHWLATKKIDISYVSLKSSFDPLDFTSSSPESVKKSRSKSASLRDIGNYDGVEDENDISGDKPGSRRKKRKFEDDFHVKGNEKASCSNAPSVPKLLCQNGPSMVKDIDKYILDAVEKGFDSPKLVSGVTELFSEQAKRGLESLNEHMVKCYQDIFFNDVVEKHKDDGLSVKSYVRDLIDHAYGNPVMMFKNQGKELKALLKDDTVLALQSPYQKEMMIQYGKKCISVDLTRKREGDNFHLFTVQVFVEGLAEVPVAWLVSNRSDNLVLNLFFKTLKINVGALQTDIFIGDTGSVFYRNWILHFPRPNKHMYCAWEPYHVLSKKLNSFIPDIEARNKVKRQLGVIAIITNTKACRNYLSALLDVLSSHQDFRDYFRELYACEGKVESWATCYRIIPLSQFIPFLCPFSRTLEHLGLYSGGGSDQILSRADLLLIKLMQISRHLEDYLQTSRSEARTSRAIRSMNIRHSQANAGRGSMSSMCCSTNFDIYASASGDSWIIRATANTNSYSIMDSGRGEDCSCQIRCDKCHFCVHKYVCTCPDYLLNQGGCFHQHAVHSFRKVNEAIGGPAMSAKGNTSSENSKKGFSRNAGSEPKMKRLKEEGISSLNLLRQKLEESSDPSELQILCDKLRDIQ